MHLCVLPCLLVVVLILIAGTSGHEESQKKYLVPVLLYGPNNQFSGLLEALALAKLTGRILVLPRYFARWYRDESSPAKMKFESVFEIEPLREYTEIVFAEEISEIYIRKEQWNVLASPVPKSRLKQAMDMLPLPCCPKRKIKLLSSHSRAKTIVTTFQETKQLRDATFVVVSPLFLIEGERRLLLEAAKFRIRAQYIREIAEHISKALFKSRRVLAVHIRRESTDLGCDDNRRYIVCPDLSKRGVSTQFIRNAIISAFQDSEVDLIYIAHAGNGPPELRNERNELIATLKANRLTQKNAVFSLSQSNELLSFLRQSNFLDDDQTSLSPFEISLIEQEICTAASVFLPSARSTWSASVTFDREAHSKRVLRPIDAALPIKSSPN